MAHALELLSEDVGLQASLNELTRRVMAALAQLGFVAATFGGASTGTPADEIPLCAWGQLRDAHEGHVMFFGVGLQHRGLAQLTLDLCLCYLPGGAVTSPDDFDVPGTPQPEPVIEPFQMGRTLGATPAQLEGLTALERKQLMSQQLRELFADIRQGTLGMQVMVFVEQLAQQLVR